MNVSIALVIGFVVFYIIYRLNKQSDRLPPGPFPKIPILGHVRMFSKKILETQFKLRQEYGDIIGLQMGVLRAIVLHDVKVLREAFNNPIFSGRPDLPIFNEASGGKYGIIFNDGESWMEQRRFTIRHMRDLGFAKKSMEALIQEEVIDFVDALAKEAGKPVDLKLRFGIVSLNSVWRLVTGERVSQNDPKMNDLLEKLHQAFQETEGGSISLFLPWLTKLFPKLTGYEKFMTASKAPFPIYEEQIESHKKNFQDGEGRDFMDAYLREMKNTVDPKSSFYGENGEKNFRAVVHDLFLGGSETTSLTLTWLILFVASHPEIQQKLFDEINKVVGKSKLPSLDDKPNMPYAEAVINETLRRSSIVPFGVMHSAMEDVEFHGYKIPKDTGVGGYFYGTHYDIKIWGDPDNFRPERFLDDKGKFQKHEAMIAFSVGKRACPGESFARDQLFLITTSIFQRFFVKLNPAEPKPSLKPINMMFLIPHPYTVVMEDRNSST